MLFINHYLFIHLVLFLVIIIEKVAVKKRLERGDHVAAWEDKRSRQWEQHVQQPRGKSATGGSTEQRKANRRK